MNVKTIIMSQPVSGSSTTSPTFVEGTATVEGQSALLIADLSTRELLEAILIELKIMNLRQQEAFEETVNEEDL